MTEEERAALYREQFVARRRARRDAFVALAGDRQARAKLDGAWRPVLIAQLEAEMPPDDGNIDALEEMYVEVPQGDIYVTEEPQEQIV